MHAEIDHFIEPLVSVQGLLWQALLTAALVAIAALIAVQLLKVPVRLAFHYLMTRRWLALRESKVKDFSVSRNQVPEWLPEHEDIYPSTEKDGYSKLPSSRLTAPSPLAWMPFVPMDLYLKKIQNVAQRALEHPREDEAAFAYFAADAAVSDMVVVYHVDALVRRNPRFLDRLTVSEDSLSSDKSMAAAVAAAQDNVSTSIERSLDDLQIRLMFWWPIVVRVVVVVVAIGLSGWFFYTDTSAHLTSSDVLLIVVIGGAAGYLASFIYDTLSLLAAFRPRPQ